MGFLGEGKYWGRAGTRVLGLAACMSCLSCVAVLSPPPMQPYYVRHLEHPSEYKPRETRSHPEQMWEVTVSGDPSGEYTIRVRGADEVDPTVPGLVEAITRAMSEKDDSETGEH